MVPLMCCDSLCLLIAAAVCYFAWWLWSTRQGDLPPGPRGLPFVGYLPFLSRNGEVQLAEISKKYGNVTRFTIGSVQFVLLGDYKAVVEAFVNQKTTFIGRPKSNLFKVKETDRGVCITDGEVWRQMRKFTLICFKEFDIGNTLMEPRILNEIGHFLNELTNFRGKSVDPSNWLGISIANIFSVFEFGRRFEYSDPVFINLVKLTDDAMTHFSSIALRALFPWTYNIPFLDSVTGESRMVHIRNEVEKFMCKKIKEHQKSQDGTMNDFIDAFLKKRQENIETTGSEVVSLEANLWILFIAGSKTTVTTLLWAILYMALYPKVQKKVQDEIDDVVGMQRAPSSTDKLPYTEATLLEIQRCGSVVPLNLEHRNSEEANLFGYKIPKDSRVISNLWAIHHDPKLWNDPHKFMPERFLNAKGEVEKPEYFIPFSIGKHICIGENMAKLELFLYLTSILQRFDIKPSANELSTKSVSGITRCPTPYTVSFGTRQGYQVSH
uniref:Cytochrome P450 n=1 Tax=Strigamia maritima TaxID=126957 RepID=T1JKI8_STRMM